MLLSLRTGGQLLCYLQHRGLRETHIISSTSIYGGTFNLFSVTMKRMGIEFTFVDPECSEGGTGTPPSVPNTKAVFERPSPTPPSPCWTSKSLPGRPMPTEFPYHGQYLRHPGELPPLPVGCDIVTHPPPSIWTATPSP